MSGHVAADVSRRWHQVELDYKTLSSDWRGLTSAATALVARRRESANLSCWLA
jgi:hypothetical protein